MVQYSLYPLNLFPKVHFNLCHTGNGNLNPVLQGYQLDFSSMFNSLAVC
jgi:hypothetical protein